MPLTSEVVQQKLQQLPLPIRDWFWSEEIADKIVEIKDKFQLYGERWGKVGDLIVRLEIKDLAWEDFKSEIGKALSVPPATAEQIFDEIKLQLLMPIARDLAAYGIGTKEFAVVAAPSPAVGPLPTATKLPPFFSTPARSTPMPATPPQQPSAPTPVPVFLRHEEPVPQAANPTFNIPMDFGNSRGNQIPQGSAIPPPPRAARVELGRSLPQTDGAVPTPVRIQRETPLPRAAGYSPIMPSVQTAIPIAAATLHTDLPPTESVKMPVETSGGTEAFAEGSQRVGIIDSVMRKVAPWHYARFSRGAPNASSVLEVPADANVVNYADVPPSAPKPMAPTIPSINAAAMPMPKPLSTEADIVPPSPPKPSV